MTASEEAKPRTAGEADAPGDDIRAQAIRGAAWMMGLQWAVRGLGIASTAILARLLTPSDFGLMAMATLTLAVIAMFGVTGQDLALIRLGRPSRDYFDSAWTIEVIAGVVLFSAALAVSPLARIYFHSAEVGPIVCVLALRLLLEGFTNIGIVYFRIDFDFSREFKYYTCRKLCAVVLGVACVLIWRNVWGLVIAGVLAKAVDVILSYAMHRFRPRFGLKRAREIWSYSSWMLVVAHGRHLAARTDEYIVGALGNAAAMGAYNVGADISVTPTVDLVQPVMRAMFPVYSRLLGDPERLRTAALRVIAATATVCLATGPGVAGIARELTLLLLGSQWSQASSLVFWFGIGAIPFGIRFAIYAILGVTDNLRLTAAAVWIRVALLIPVLVVAGRWGGVAAIAEAQALLGLLTLCADIAVLRLAVKVGFADFARCVMRPLAAAVTMTIVLAICERSVHLPLAMSLVVKIAAGAVAYLGSLTVLWLLARRPDGIERVAVAVMANAIARYVRRRR
ncbi:MAG TPA: oligosaccharide flippase family protein [Stellaceae bacterium]|nr:oligosaccharide flippase family protein [Stellaceae bacterium]